MYGKFYFSFMLGLLLTAAVYGQNKPTRVVTDADLGTGSYLWSQDTVYLLDGYVFLETGGILNIERGTVIKGINKPTNASDNASALIITKGAMINARGTAEEPIIFTAELDDVNDPTDLGALDKGLWGGLILLGNATVGEDGGFDNIEGIPADEGRAEYGGDKDDDNSGVLTYISIRHGGAALQADNEINGLTLGGVGSGTQIHHIEVFANEDDGIEFFGGTVDLKYGATIFCGDDGFDYDESWSGRGQFWFYISETDNGNCAGEHDGSERTDKQPKSFPVIYNATYIGSGSASGNAASIGLDMKDDAAAIYANSVFTGFSTGVRFRNRGTSDAYSRYMTDGDTKFLNNLWWDFAAGNDPNNFVVITDNQNGGVVADVVAKLVAEGNEVVNPQLSGISRTPNQQLDPRPNSGSPAYSNAVAATDEWFDAVTYRGAFDAKNNWMLSWTATDELGYFGDLFNPTVEYVRDEDLVAGGTYTFTNDKEWILDGYVFLEEGGSLTIQPGTVIKGKNQPTNASDNASALIITKGATINACGTADQPIIFTAELDDVNDPTDLGAQDKGLWGGLILLGNATVGEDGGFDNIEGIPADEGRAQYGGDNDADNSGSLCYISIRHGGAALQADNEINGLTLGGVGSGTQIHHIEVFANEDDGIEFFGGTVDLKYGATIFCGDDGFDYDESWSGRGQFWFYISETDNGNCAGEHDGSERTDKQPKSFPVIYNATYIGSGSASGNAASIGLDMKDDAAAVYANSVFTGFSTGVRFRNRGTSDAYSRYMTDGDTKFLNNLWWDFAAGNDPNNFVVITDNQNGGVVADVVAKLVAEGNEVVNPQLSGISRTPNQQLDPRPNSGSPAYSNAVAATDEWFDAVTYRGAFDAKNNWMLSWTATDELGYFGDLFNPTVEFVRDEDLVAGGTYTFTNDKEWILDGYVFLEEGGSLTIQPGTVIKGKNQPTNASDNASALIITKGATINACGTADQPIIFTAELDDVNDPTDLGAQDKGLWGGLILLGNATVGEDGGFDNIEGIPADEGRAQYGGDNDADNSGSLCYISIRHGGAALQADNEINGLTLGGVGSGTQIHHIEVFANEDDGIEFFGGTVDLKYGATIFCGDDGFDYDESWSGRGQFWFYISETDNGNCAGEHDGSERTDKQPKSFPVIYNATYIGSGSASGNAASIGLDMKDDAAAIYANSVFTGFSTGVRFRNRGTSDAYSRYMTDGDTKFLNNLWWDFAAGNDPNNFVVITDNQNGGVVADVVAKLVAEGNEVIDPTLRGISRVPNQQLDPLPAAGSPLHQDLAVATDSWFDVVDFKGAFGFDNWMFGWTALDKYGYLGDLSNTSTDFERNASGVSLMVPYPNPVTQGVATLAFELPASSDITVSVFDLTGRMVANTRYGKFVQGAHNLQLVTENFHSGLYVVALQTDFGTVTQKISVLKNN